MQGLYSGRSEDNVVNGYGRSLLETCAGFEFMILNGICSSDPKGSFTLVSPHGNSIIDYFIVSADLLRNNIDMSVQSRIESWHMPVTQSLNIRNNAAKSAPMSEISIERFVWSNVKANEFIEKMNSEEVKNNVNFLQENVYLDTESCLMSLCNILKDAAQVMRKASTFKTGKSKFRSGWYDHECYTYKAQRSLRRYRNWISAVRKAEYIQNRKSYKKNCWKKRRKHTRIMK